MSIKDRLSCSLSSSPMDWGIFRTVKSAFNSSNDLAGSVDVRNKSVNAEELSRRLSELQVETDAMNESKRREIGFGDSTDDEDDQGVFYSNHSTPSPELTAPSSRSSPNLMNDSRDCERGRSVSNISSATTCTSSSTSTSANSLSFAAFPSTGAGGAGSSSQVDRTPFLPLSSLQRAAYSGDAVATAALLRKAGAAGGADQLYEAAAAKGYEFSGLTAVEIAEQRGHYHVSYLIQQAIEQHQAISFGRGGGYGGSQSQERSLSTSPTTIDGSDEGNGAGAGDEWGGRPSDDRSPSQLGVGSEDGYKSPSEDRVVVLPMEVEGMMLYAIFDGHNGSHVSDIASKCLPAKIKHALAELHRLATPEQITPDLLSQLVARCIASLDEEIMRQAERTMSFRSGGSTACVVLETRSHLIVANLGDTPAAVFDATTGRLLAITDDHTPSHPGEFRRVCDQGGMVVSNPEYGDFRMCSPKRTSTVSVTRALGQWDFKAGAGILDPAHYSVTSSAQVYVWSKEALLLGLTAQPLLAASVGEGVGEGGDTGCSRAVSMSVVDETETQAEAEGECPQGVNNNNKNNTSTSSSSSSSNDSALEAPAPRLFLALYSDSFTEAVIDSLTAPIDPITNRPPQLIANTVPHDQVVFRLSAALQRQEYHATRAATQLCRSQVGLFRIGGAYCGDNTSLILAALSR